MKTVLVTGGCGFIGRHVVEELLGKGYSVRVIDALIDQVHDQARYEVPQGVELIAADLRDRPALRRALEGIDGVIHLAAEVGVGQSMYEIARYVGGNDLATAELLEAMIDRPVGAIVVASSMSVYGEGLYRDPAGTRLGDRRREPQHLKAGRWDLVTDAGEPLEPIPTDESKPLDLSSIYALTKYAQERATLIFGRAYERHAVALRLFNVFGPGQALSNPYTGVLANFASRIANDRPPLVFEDGRQKRDFVHVRDIARAFRLALETRAANGEVINIGSGSAYAIADVATLLARAMGRPDIAPQLLGKYRAGDIRNCFADIAKAEALLGFAPRHRLEDSLGDFVRWVAGAPATDRAEQMQRELERHRLVS